MDDAHYLPSSMAAEHTDTTTPADVTHPRHPPPRDALRRTFPGFLHNYVGDVHSVYARAFRSLLSRAH